MIAAVLAACCMLAVRIPHEYRVQRAADAADAADAARLAAAWAALDGYAARLAKTHDGMA